MTITSPEMTALAAALHGQYAVEREIGRGGMGIVYLARDLRLDRHVAIKTLPAHLAGNAEVRERFLREARTAAQLSHPGIVPIHRADEIDGQVFFVMGYVNGESLAQRIHDRRRQLLAEMVTESLTHGPALGLPVAETIRQLRDVALALGYAHARGVVHRDVKAENILIERATGRAVVTDFGIARLAESKPLTATGQVLGTVHYMSPEQVTGEAVDGRSDVYALGVVAFLALSGHFPFDSETPSAILVAHVTKPAPRLRFAAPDLPASITAVVDRCLAKDPAERFETCGALVAALDAVSADAERADAERATAGRALVSETQAQAVWRRAAELQALTSAAPAVAAPAALRPGRPLSESSAYRLDDVRSSAVDAGIGDAYIERALAEHGLAGGGPSSAAPPPARAARPAVAIAPREPGANWFLGSPTRILVEATVEGEAPERDYDLLLEIIRGELAEVGQIGSVGRTLSWGTSSQNRKLQIAVIPRGGKTTIRIDEQLQQLAGGMFGGIMGGVGGGAGAATMGVVMGTTHEPLVGLASWLGVVAAAYATARFSFARLSRGRRRKLHELAERLAAQIAESIAADRHGPALGAPHSHPKLPR